MAIYLSGGKYKILLFPHAWLKNTHVEKQLGVKVIPMALPGLLW